jgi:peptidoglycan/LPS O-acetylase OafA/YrhL
MSSAVLRGAQPSPPPAVEPPPGNERFPLLDALRAIAALSVLVHHVTEAQGPPARLSVADFAIHLNAGVAVFFVISGFVLYRPYLVHRHLGGPAIRPLGYARRRVLRIVPGYWVALTVLAIYPGLTFPGGAWRYYLFGQVYSPNTLFGGLPPAWTLCAEVAFYAALPLIALAAGRLFGPRRHWLRLELLALGACIVASWCLHVWLGRLAPASAVAHFNVAFTLPGVVDWFALGMALAALSVAGRLPRVPPEVAWALAAAVFAACVMLPQDEPLLHGLFGVLGVLLVLPALVPAGGSPVQRLLALRPLALLGLVSYGIYLWNQPIVVDLATHGARSFPVLLVATLAITVTLATLSYRLVEAPALRLKYRSADRSR